MAYGVIKVIAASGHVEANLSGTGGGDSYPAVKILNPNDGVVYIARNRDALSAGYGDWDWKVPSQSYAMLPGPFQSIGMFYLDQSGAGRQGEIAVYVSNQHLDDPVFLAIGRAIQAQVTSLDITQGAQPQNPPTGVERIWVDTVGAFGALIGSGVTNWNFRDMVRISGTEAAVPTQGNGTEIGFQPNAVPPLGSIAAFNRDTSQYLRFDVHGAPLNLTGHTDSSTVHLLDGSGHTLTQVNLGLRTRVVNIASGAVGQALYNTGGTQGLVWFVDGFGRAAQFSFRNSNTLKINDPDAVWSTLANNAGTSNFYWSTGNSRYELQNNSGTTFNYLVLALQPT